MEWNFKEFTKSYQEQHGKSPSQHDFETAFEESIQSTTLRVGSSDGCKSMHTDEEQMQDVVQPLAEWFGIKQYMRTVATLVEHVYVEQDSSSAGS